MIVGRANVTRSVVATVGRPVAFYTGVAAVVSAVHIAGWRWLDVPALPVSLLAATLGILLGFRNNSGYNRWWEARTLWGGVVSQSRTFARQLLTFLPAAPDAAEPVPAPSSAAWSADGFDGAVRDVDGAARLRADAVVGAVGGVTPRVIAARVADAPLAVTAEVRELVYYAQIRFANALRCHLRREDLMPVLVPFFAPPPCSTRSAASRTCPPPSSPGPPPDCATCSTAAAPTTRSASSRSTGR